MVVITEIAEPEVTENLSHVAEHIQEQKDGDKLTVTCPKVLQNRRVGALVHRLFFFDYVHFSDVNLGHRWHFNTFFTLVAFDDLLILRPLFVKSIHDHFS